MAARLLEQRLVDQIGHPPRLVGIGEAEGEGLRSVCEDVPAGQRLTGQRQTGQSLGREAP